MEEYFNEDGHLTDYAIKELICGEPDELTRLEISEHLSFCDDCLLRYTLALDSETLLTPDTPLADSIMRNIKSRVRRVFLNRYATAAVAACFAMALWTNGIFHVEDYKKNLDLRPVRKIEYNAGSLSDQLSEKFNELANDIYGLKGVFEYGK